MRITYAVTWEEPEGARRSGRLEIGAELSDRLGVLTGDPKTVETAAIVVQLRPGSRAEVETLLRNGPPFDPSRLGLVRHEVFVSEQEAIFVFHGLPSVFAQRLAEDDSFWSAATAWRRLVRGRARFAEAAYSWS